MAQGLLFIRNPFILPGISKKVREVLDKDPNPRVRMGQDQDGYAHFQPECDNLWDIKFV